LKQEAVPLDSRSAPRRGPLLGPHLGGSKRGPPGAVSGLHDEAVSAEETGSQGLKLEPMGTISGFPGRGGSRHMGLEIQALEFGWEAPFLANAERRFFFERPG
jgi:hypothetical protein